jgi:hypothetical protein
VFSTASIFKRRLGTPTISTNAILKIEDIFRDGWKHQIEIDFFRQAVSTTIYIWFLMEASMGKIWRL